MSKRIICEEDRKSEMIKVRVTSDTVDRLNRLSEASGLTRSEIVRQAIDSKIIGGLRNGKKEIR